MSFQITKSINKKKKENVEIKKTFNIIYSCFNDNKSVILDFNMINRDSFFFQPQKPAISFLFAFFASWSSKIV